MCRAPSPLIVNRGKMNYAEEEYDFYTVMPVSDLPDGERVFVEIDDFPIVIFNIADGLYAVKDLCSHEDLEMGDGDLEGYELVCPHHGAHFDLRTGAAMTLPAVEGVSVYPVRVQEGMIEIGLPRES